MSRFIHFLIDSGYCRYVQKAPVTKRFPRVYQYQYKRPVFSFGIPFNRRRTKEIQYAVINHTIFNTEKCIYDVTDNDPGYYERKKYRTLIYFSAKFSGYITDHNCHSNTQNKVYDNKCYIIQKGISDNQKSILFKEIFKIT